MSISVYRFCTCLCFCSLSLRWWPSLSCCPTGNERWVGGKKKNPM